MGINSIVISKSNSESMSSVKYDIQVSLDEVENSDTSSKLKYSFTLLTNPKNVRIITEGITTISGKNDERSKIFEEDKNNIPNIVHLIYQDLFPVLFMTTKSMQIPCPPYKLFQINKTDQSETLQELENLNVEDNKMEEPQVAENDKSIEETKPAEETEVIIPTDKEIEESPKDEIKEIVEEVKTEADVQVPKAEIKEKVEQENKPEEKNFDSMTDDQLREAYNKLSEDYKSNPSQEILDDMSKINTILNKRLENQQVIENPT